MIKSKRLVVVLILASLGLLVFAGLRLANHPERNSLRDPAPAVEPSQTHPAMTTESVPQYRDDGVMPTPSDAVGQWKPNSVDESSKK